MIPTPEMLDAMKKALVRYSPIMPIDEALSDALTAALALLPGETVAWEVAETLPSGTIRWQVVEHEHHARKLAEKLQADVRPLYASPAPLPVAVKELNHIPNLLGESGAIELKMIALADASPQRDPFNGEQTILTYTDRVGTWDLAFFESGEEFPDRWIGCSHWLDITKMWPGVIAQIARYKNPASMIKGELGGGDVIALVNPDRWQQDPQLAYANGWNDCLADRLQATDGDYDANAQKLAEACYLECEQMDSYGIIDTIAKYIRSALSSPVGGAEGDCRHCKGKGCQPGDPEGAPLEPCDYCGGSGKISPTPVSNIAALREEIARIAGDFVPDRDADAPLALQEMRDALMELAHHVAKGERG